MIGVGLLLALCSSVFKASKSVTTKVGATETDSYLTSWATRAFSLPTFLIAGLVAGVALVPIGKGWMYWGLVVAKGLFTAATTVLLAEAMRKDDLSLVAPLLSFVPIAVAIPSFIVLGEIPSPIAGVGLLLVAVGSYLLNVHAVEEGLLGPLRALASSSGAKYVFASLAIIAVSPTVDKLGIQASTPLAWVFVTHVLSVVILSVTLPFTGETTRTSLALNWKVLVAVGVFSSMIWVFQAYAYTFTQVSYVQAVKRLSVLLSVLAGGWFFDEEFTRQRFVASVLVVLGVLSVAVGAL